MKITFLGTGTSHGIPVIGCPCSVCQSRDARDRRTRASLLVEVGHKTLLVDAGPELRLQLVRERVNRIDAMLLTHDHADHVAGIDDLRIFSERTQKPFPIYGPKTALQSLRRRFDYVFRRTQAGGGKPKLRLIPVREAFFVEGIQVIPVPLWHGRVRVMGYRIGGMVYLTDVSAIPEASYELLEHCRVLILDALRYEPHPTHFNLDQALAEAGKIKAIQTYFTHLCHLLPHRQTNRHLPPGMQLAYDGLKITLR